MTRRILVYLAILIGIFGLTARVNAQSAVVSEAQRISGDRFTIVTRTPQGATVYATSQPNKAMLDTIDAGLIDLFNVARKNGYRRNLNPSNYTIFIAKPDRMKDASGNYSPDIAIGAAQYKGSVYDQGGFIYVAGMVVAFNPGAFLIAEHSQNLNRVRDIVRYEGEHIVLYHNDRRRFEATRDHSQGGGHPILQ